MTIKTFNMTKKDLGIYLSYLNNLDYLPQMTCTTRTIGMNPTTDDVIETVKEVTGKDIFGKEDTPERDHWEDIIDNYLQECEDLKAPVRAFFIVDMFRGLVCVKNDF